MNADEILTILYLLGCFLTVGIAKKKVRNGVRFMKEELFSEKQLAAKELPT